VVSACVTPGRRRGAERGVPLSPSVGARGAAAARRGGRRRSGVPPLRRRWGDGELQRPLGLLRRPGNLTWPPVSRRRNRHIGSTPNLLTAQLQIFEVGLQFTKVI
ncbi:mCG19183, isoform CRA_d, partial [Mus musculus]